MYQNEYHERFCHLLRVLNDVAADHKAFNMSHWIKREPECGTSACAVGWATMDPWFNQQGFTHVQTWGAFSKDILTPVFEDVEAWDAVEAFFWERAGYQMPVIEAQRFDRAEEGEEIIEESLYLFDPVYYPEFEHGIPVEAVLARVRAYVLAVYGEIILP